MAKQVGKFLTSVVQQTREVLEVLKDAAVDLSWDLRDAAEGGFGLPKLASSAASLGVAGVAAAGTASICMEVAGKYIGRRECNTCNGWEALRCTSCGGVGMVQFAPKNLSMSEPTAASVGKGIKEGTVEIEHFPTTFNMGLPLPTKSCPSCDGTGVVLCHDCKGQSWKFKFSADEVLNVPWTTWDVYRKTKAPEEGKKASMADPEWAAFNLFGRRELEEGIEFDKDVKEKMMWQWKESRKYDEIRDLVAKREPGWEEMQKLLTAIDPERALKDPVIVRNVPYFKARQQIESQVAMLDVPPRPADWEAAKDIKLPLEESDWEREELKDPRKLAEVRKLLQGVDSVQQKVLDSAWEQAWREQKVRDIVKEKIDSYLASGGEQAKKTTQATSPLPEESSSKTGPSGSTKSRAPQQKAAGSKKLTEDQQKKKERQERAERLAKQAADREAALQRAKAAKARK